MFAWYKKMGTLGKALTWAGIGAATAGGVCAAVNLLSGDGNEAPASDGEYVAGGGAAADSFAVVSHIDQTIV